VEEKRQKIGKEKNGRKSINGPQNRRIFFDQIQGAGKDQEKVEEEGRHKKKGECPGGVNKPIDPVVRMRSETAHQKKEKHGAH